MDEHMFKIYLQCKYQQFFAFIRKKDNNISEINLRNVNC